MKIDQTNSLTRLTQSDALDQKRNVKQAESASSPAGSTTTLSQIDTQNTSGDIDTARVAEVRQAIADGTLQLDTSKIADGLIQSVRDMLDERG
ncbi:flagellar biosynthesis anti-sigma factor FlgM [Salinicola endophyticus]|uniref:Negative regulator of flagellin synthesis n=1 Tax=Salinicola endophyticus TaxID=1949083 RepID=A0ABY8FMC6_9GAMM|nr:MULTISPECIES: flagellar biosynthesis anti-sigma factor FlgM [Salinicola]WFF42818.1 flagellar biosynthesis anti-sigma factor FlgM [Salinicola endophyticus]